MPKRKKVSNKEILDALADVLREHGDVSKRLYSSLTTKYSYDTYRGRFGTWNYAKSEAKKILRKRGEKVRSLDVEKERLRRQLDELEREVKRLREEQVSAEDIKKQFFDIKNATPDIPDWLTDIPKKKKAEQVYGVPILQVSDIHWGETVKPEQVFGKNEFNIEIGKYRLNMLTRNTIEVLNDHLFGGGAREKYPGIVLAFNGDFIAGNIHEELTITNDKPVMPVVLSCFGNLINLITAMADNYKRVMIFCTAGNHGRTTRRVPTKDKAWTSFDWLIYCLLEKWFINDPRVCFCISNGEDVQFNVYNHRYRQTHGDQFRGGQGFVGPYAPITRGELKKQTAATSYDLGYDTLILGHFHTYMPMDDVMCNGSIVGFDEFSVRNNFRYRPPVQALWVTHPKYGITFRMPVFCDKRKITQTSEWVSWKKEGPSPAEMFS